MNNPCVRAPRQDINYLKWMMVTEFPMGLPLVMEIVLRHLHQVLSHLRTTCGWKEQVPLFFRTKQIQSLILLSVCSDFINMSLFQLKAKLKRSANPVHSKLPPWFPLPRKCLPVGSPHLGNVPPRFLLPRKSTNTPLRCWSLQTVLTAGITSQDCQLK